MDLKQHALRYKKRSELFWEVQKVCRDLLLHHPEAKQARDYLNSRVSKENQARFQFGYFPPDDKLHLLLERVSERKLLKLGLVYKFHVQNDDYRVYVTRGMMNSHNLITPYIDVYGNIVAFVGRTTLAEEDRKDLNLDKYRYTKGFTKSLHLFGINQAKSEILKKGSVVLVEGQIDCVTCHEFGIHNVVALGGVVFSKHQRNLLCRLAKKFYLLLDNDPEGTRAQTKIRKRDSGLIQIEQIILPNDVKDVDIFLRTHNDVSIFNC